MKSAGMNFFKSGLKGALGGGANAAGELTKLGSSVTSLGKRWRRYRRSGWRAPRRAFQ
jgi:hypothetical protein